MNYRLQIASDVIRDGLGLELLNSRNEVVAEVFRSDQLKTLTFTAFATDTPFIEIEKLVQFARSELQAFEDGTPFPAPVIKHGKAGF